MLIMMRTRAEAGGSGAPPGFVGRGVSGEGRAEIWLCLGADLLLLPLLGGSGLTGAIVLIIEEGAIVGFVLATQFGAFTVQG